MKKSLLALVALTTVSHAGDLPVVGQFDPRYASGYYPGTMEINGVKTQVTLKNFGSDSAKIAEEYGRHLAPKAYSNEVAFDEMVTRKGMEIFHDPYEAHLFDVLAKKAYMNEMRRNSITH